MSVFCFEPCILWYSYGMKHRCSEEWTGNDPVLMKYHDEEWGKPEHDEQKLTELFMLELFQAGLSWSIILHKRENFRKAFDDFDPEKISRYDEKKVNELMQNPGIIRNRKKIEATVNNASVILKIRKEYGSFSKYLWHFTNDQSVLEEIHVTHDSLSDDMSADLKKRGMRFTGTVTVYSFLQAAGIIYSHTKECFRYQTDNASSFEGNHYVSKRRKQ